MLCVHDHVCMHMWEVHVEVHVRVHGSRGNPSESILELLAYRSLMILHDYVGPTRTLGDLGVTFL